MQQQLYVLLRFVSYVLTCPGVVAETGVLASLPRLAVVHARSIALSRLSWRRRGARSWPPCVQMCASPRRRRRWRGSSEHKAGLSGMMALHTLRSCSRTTHFGLSASHFPHAF